MRLVHWIGVSLLIANATFFTDDLISSVMQYVVAITASVREPNRQSARLGETLARFEV